MPIESKCLVCRVTKTSGMVRQELCYHCFDLKCHTCHKFAFSHIAMDDHLKCLYDATYFKRRT